ncbi:extensin [Streptomyces sp. NPDC052040]|uniref:extensin n=1 Tax=Streptomyces sp. NPDC052040 TaxID=3365682 RepID=UPI0037D100DB
MADEQYRWLDGDAAERLLRGEPLDTVDGTAREQAARLAETLASLAVTPSATSAELSGEAAALAAFRAARSEAAPAREALAGPGSAYAAHHGSDAGLVRLGRPAANGPRTGANTGRNRWGRPLRFGLAAAVAAGTIGGVAFAAGTGVLPTPFQREPGPAASVTADTSSQEPLRTPTPGATASGGPTAPTTPGSTSEESTPGGPARDEAGAGATSTPLPGDPTGDHPGGRAQNGWSALRSSCEDMVVGRVLGDARLRDLRDAAGGDARVKTFCKVVLGGGDGTNDGRDGGDGKGSGHDGGGAGGHGGGGGLGGTRGGNGGGGKPPAWPGGLGGIVHPTGSVAAPVSALATPNPR